MLQLSGGLYFNRNQTHKLKGKLYLVVWPSKDHTVQRIQGSHALGAEDMSEKWGWWLKAKRCFMTLS